MRSLLLASAVIAGALAGSASAAVTASSGDQVILFNGQNFQGPSVRLTGDSPNLNIFGVNSVRAGGQTWKICSQPNFTGKCVTVTGDDGRFAAKALPGVRSAMRLDQISGPGAQPSEASQIEFFNSQNYQGPSTRITRDTPNLQLPWGANSVRLYGQVWQVCSEPNYAGRCSTMTQDNGHFQSIGKPAAARSVRRLDKLGGSTGPSGPVLRPPSSGGPGSSHGTGSGQGGPQGGQGGQQGGQGGQGGWQGGQGGQGGHHHGTGGPGYGGSGQGGT